MAAKVGAWKLLAVKMVAVPEAPVLLSVNVPAVEFNQAPVDPGVPEIAPSISNLASGEASPIPTLELVVSTVNNPELILKAVVEEDNVQAAEPEEAVIDKAPVDIVNPLEAVKVPAEVIAPLEVVEMLPVVERVPALVIVNWSDEPNAKESVEVAGLIVVPDLCQKPTVPEEEPVMLPVQVKLPVELATVQPVAEEPPAILTSTAPSAWRLRDVPLELMVAAVPRVKVVVEVAESDAAVVKVEREEAVIVLVPDKVVVELVKVVVDPKVILEVAPESKMSFPVTWKSSATTVFVPVLSIVKLPEESTVNLESLVLSVSVNLSCSVVDNISTLASGVVSPTPTLLAKVETPSTSNVPST